MARLADRFTVYAPTHPGFGSSDAADWMAVPRQTPLGRPSREAAMTDNGFQVPHAPRYSGMRRQSVATLQVRHLDGQWGLRSEHAV
jgi:hypothetical protein